MKLDKDGMPIIDEENPLIDNSDDDDGDDLLGLDFDEDGNLIESGIPTVEDEDDEQSDDNESDEEVEEAEIPQADDEEVETSNRVKPTKAEMKIINLKKANAELIKKQAELQKQLEEQSTNKEQAKLVDKYVSDGYDEDTAKEMASNKIELMEMKKKLETLTFKEENEELFSKYPEAKKNLALIMNNSRLTGMTAEQICKGLYGNAIPANEARAMASAKGQSTRTTNPNTNVARVATGTNSNDKSSLTQEQLNYKRRLEQTFGRKIDTEEFLKLKSNQ